jgi:hypothetical protein
MRQFPQIPFGTAVDRLHVCQSDVLGRFHSLVSPELLPWWNLLQMSQVLAPRNGAAWQGGEVRES